MRMAANYLSAKLLNPDNHRTKVKYLKNLDW